MQGKHPVYSGFDCNSFLYMTLKSISLFRFELNRFCCLKFESIVSFLVSTLLKWINENDIYQFILGLNFEVCWVIYWRTVIAINIPFLGWVWQLSHVCRWSILFYSGFEFWGLLNDLSKGCWLINILFIVYSTF